MAQKKRVQVQIEFGHQAISKDNPANHFTHDWTVFVKGVNDISHIIEKVVFHLHESFPEPKRVCKEPPYTISDEGYGSFTLPIEVFFKTTSRKDPRKHLINYELTLQLCGLPPLNATKIEALTFLNPSNEFETRLLKAGAIIVPSGGEESPKAKIKSSLAPPSHNSSNPHKISNTTQNVAKEEDFSCPICLDTVDEAVETTCCHQIFCERCLRIHRETSCPKCRYQPYTTTVNYFVRKLVGNFRVKCSNERCVTIVSRSELKDHKAKCPYEIVRCPNDGCKTRVKRLIVDAHSKECGYCLITCLNEGCLLRVARRDMKEHDRSCDHAVITCNNEGCHEIMKQLKLKKHQREECRFMTVKCPVPNCRYQDVVSKVSGHIGEEHHEVFIRHLSEMTAIYSID